LFTLDKKGGTSYAWMRGAPSFLSQDPPSAFEDRQIRYAFGSTGPLFRYAVHRASVLLAFRIPDLRKPRGDKTSPQHFLRHTKKLETGMRSLLLLCCLYSFNINYNYLSIIVEIHH